MYMAIRAMMEAFVGTWVAGCIYTMAQNYFFRSFLAMSTNQFHLILLGPPGSGKGTQATVLAHALHIPHISTGDLFRDNIKRNTSLGQTAKGYIERGELTPDALVLDMLFERLALPDCGRGFLLDGFPRTIAQADIFGKKYPDLQDLIVLNLEVPDELITKRIAGRLTCQGCGKAYNRYFSPSQVDGICDACQGKLYQRPDDSAAVVSERLKNYHAQSSPLVAYYQEKSVLKHINGDAPPAQVQEELINNIKQ
jgi:adenylate kinase